MTRTTLLAGVGAILLGLAPVAVQAQTAANLRALEGLVAASALPLTEAGRAALAANYAVTGAIQTGELRLPGLGTWDEQQRRSIRDAFITNRTNNVVADALGTKLEAAFDGFARYTDYRTAEITLPAVATLFTYTNSTTGSDSNAGKYVLANGTMDGKAPVSAAGAEVLTHAGAKTDVFGTSYGKPAGSEGADPFGNSRPFQTEPKVLRFEGPDYFGKTTTNMALLAGPDTDLRDSPSYPSGHTTYGTQSSIILALMVPERLEPLVARAAEYGQSRVLLGAHYAMDVVAGRALALHDIAHLLANDPDYVGPAKGGVTVADYRAAFAAARAELRAALEKGCGDTIAVCAGLDTSRFADAAARDRLLDATRTYGLPAVKAAVPLDYAVVAPEAGNLLVAAYPSLSLADANAILTETQRPGGGFLEGGPLGPYARLDLVAAPRRAATTAAR